MRKSKAATMLRQAAGYLCWLRSTDIPAALQNGGSVAQSAELARIVRYYIGPMCDGCRSTPWYLINLGVHANHVTVDQAVAQLLNAAYVIENYDAP